MKNLTTRVPNYMQIFFPYSTVTSSCQGSVLVLTLLLFLECYHTCRSIFITKTNPFILVSEWNKYSKL